MRNNLKKNRENILIVLGPVLIIMMIITLGLVPMDELNKWDLAISISAIVTLMLFYLKDTRRGR